MTEIADRYRKVAAGFTARVDAVPDDAWDNAAPCEGWTARDVVGHLCGWVPGMIFDGAGLDAPEIPSVDDDPAAAWHALDDALAALLDDPIAANAELELQVGRHTLPEAIDRFVTGDVLFHTWDLARATGLDEALDPEEVHAALVAMAPMDDVLRQSGHFGPKVEVPDDADEQTRLIAFLGRQP